MMEMINRSRITGWHFVLMSFIPFMVGTVYGTRDIAPTVPDHIDGWAVFLGAIVACWSIACFLMCPRRPVAAKLIAFCVCVPAVFVAFWFASIYYEYATSPHVKPTQPISRTGGSADAPLVMANVVVALPPVGYLFRSADRV